MMTNEAITTEEKAKHITALELFTDMKWTVGVTLFVGEDGTLIDYAPGAGWFVIFGDDRETVENLATSKEAVKLIIKETF